MVAAYFFLRYVDLSVLTLIMILSNQASYHVGAARPFISKILLFSAFSQLSQNLYNKVTCISFQSYKKYDWMVLIGSFDNELNYCQRLH